MSQEPKHWVRWLNDYGPTILIVGLILGSSLYIGFTKGWS